MEHCEGSALEKCKQGAKEESEELLDYLSEGPVDSDDEQSIGDESETSASATSLDAIQEVLSKPSGDRTDEDIEKVMDVLQYMPVFSNMTSNVRRAIFQVLMLSTIENEHTVIIDNGEEVKNWYVVLNGQFNLQRDSNVDKTYTIGDCFGVNQSLKVLPQRGRLVSATKDCAVGYVSVTDYVRIQTQAEERMMSVVEKGTVVARLGRPSLAIDAKYFVVVATPEKLLEYLLDASVDDNFHKDYLLTYRLFLKSPVPIVEALRTAWGTGLPEQRERITMIVLYWVTEHFPDFEGSAEMTDFLDWFEERLLEDNKVCEKKALDEARSLRARIRNIEMDRASASSPLSFEVVGGWELGHPIFVSTVEPNSIPERAGLRVGDQILEINDAKGVKQELREVLSILNSEFRLSLRVRSNLPGLKQFLVDPCKAPPEYHQKSKTPSLVGHSNPQVVGSVVKLYQSDLSHKYIGISPTTTVAELISRGVKEFFPHKFIAAPTDEYCICMVTVQSQNGPIHNTVLPNHMTDLANFIGLESRYYLKERAFHGTLVQDEETGHIFKESCGWEGFLSLSPKQVTEELTRQNSEMFSSIDSTEYICNLLDNPDPLTRENISKFRIIHNEEKFWVVTTIVSEPNSDMRAKIIKHFIKIAGCCKEQKNYFTMINILRGLDHTLVRRLQSTWEKVPSKVRKNFKVLQNFLDPSRTFVTYRRLLHSTTPPLIPWLLLIQWDLYYINQHNLTWIHGLVNFEKLRMISQAIRVSKTYCQQTIMPEPLLKNIRRSVRLPTQTMHKNALMKEVYQHQCEMKMVRKHLAGKYVIQDEKQLKKMSDEARRTRPKLVEIRDSDLEFMEKVGSGGFGSVWKGWWKSNKKTVAIKTLVDIDEREVSILNSLVHPCIIQFYGVVIKKPSCYIVTEYAEKGSIYDYIHKRRGQPSATQSLLWAKEVAEGMIYLHDQDIIHRDLKSSNVVLTSELKAKICDLGSARRLEQTVKQTTIIGTYAWMAPEMMEGVPVSKSCDVYSYGIFVWELVTQELPFSDVKPPFMVMPRVMAGEHPPIPEKCETYLAKLLTDCWQMEAKARPSFKDVLVILNTGASTAK